MQTNPYPNSNSYSNTRNETAYINKYVPLGKLSQGLIQPEQGYSQDIWEKEKGKEGEGGRGGGRCQG